MKSNLLLLILLFFTIDVLAQHPNSLVRKGNASYTDSLYSEAEQKYREALIKDQNSYAASFNLADAIYKQEKFSESTSLFKALSEKTQNKIEKSESLHNLGNSLMKEQKINEAIDAYKNALRNNPKDMDTKHNLAYAQRIKNQQQKQEEEKEEEQDKDEEKEEEKEEEEKQEDEKEEEKNEQEQNENSEEESKEEPTKPQDPNEMTEDEAEQILDALQQQEKELQEDLQKKKNKGVKLKILKDW
ncbi:MAG: tetratricopeptide repeat protein [Flavobacteriales bacterium]|nr:tetratricopeptide repeat protein [Flavobacteriales bacterium]MBL6873350.1 tetratricopeptide repeat protein [Flavobacteriales bacterium]